MSGIANWQAQITLDIESLKKRIKVAEDELGKVSNKEHKVKLELDTKTLESAIQKLDKMLDSLGKETGDFKQLESLSKELSSIVTEVQSLSKAFGKVDDSGAKTLLSSIQNIDRSLSDLSQNILNVNKNMSNMGSNTSSAVRQVENITKASKEATSALSSLNKEKEKIINSQNNSSTTSKTTISEADAIKQAFSVYEQESINFRGSIDNNKKKVEELLKTLNRLNNMSLPLARQVNNSKYIEEFDESTVSNTFLNKTITKLPNNNLKEYVQYALNSSIPDRDLLKTMGYYYGSIYLNKIFGFSELKSKISKDKASELNKIANEYVKQGNEASSKLCDVKEKISSAMNELALTMGMEQVPSFSMTSLNSGMHFNGYGEKELQTISLKSIIKNPQVLNDFYNYDDILNNFGLIDDKNFSTIDEMKSKIQSLVSEKEKLKDNLASDSEINNIQYKIDAYQHLLRIVEKIRTENTSQVQIPNSSTSNQEKIQEELKETENQAEKTAQAVKEVPSTTPEKDLKDAIPNADNQTNIESEMTAMEQVEKATDEAVQAKKDFATANEGVQNSVDDSKSPLQLEAELMEQIAKSAREAADAKKEFVEANKLVEKSANDSNSELKNGHSENAEPANVRKYKRKDNATPAKDTGNHDNEVVVNNKTELGKVLKQLQSEIIASIDESTSFVKEVTDFYDSQNNLVKTQMKIGDNNGSMRTYTTSYSKDKDGNATAWTSHIETQKIAEQVKQQAQAQLEVDKQLAKEEEELAKAQQKKAQAFQKEQVNYESEQKKADVLAKQKAAYDELMNTIKQYSEVTKRVSSGNAEDGDIDKMSKLEDKISQLQKQPILSSSQVEKSEKSLVSLYEQLDKIERKVVETNQKQLTKNLDNIVSTNATRITNLENSKPVEKDRSNEYQGYISQLKSFQEQIVAIQTKANERGFVTQEDLDKANDLQKKYVEIDNTIKQMKTSAKGSTEASRIKEIDKLNKAMQSNTNITAEARQKLEDYLKDLRYGDASTNVEEIHTAWQKVINDEIAAGRGGTSFIQMMKNSGIHKWAADIAGMFSFYDVINIAKQGINTIRELDEAMTEVRKVSEASDSQYESFQKTVASTAKEIASTNKELLNSSADFLRLGYSLDQAENLAKNATLFVNVGDGVDIDAATEDMITAMKAFDIKAENSIKIVDDYNQIGNMYALSATDIGEAMKRSASALETGNNSFEESIALITAMNEIVQNSENTGNTLKVFSLRLRGAKAELEDMGEDTDGLCESSSKLREQLQALTGVDIMLNDNTFKSTTQITKELGAVWNKLSDSSQAATLELIAGKTRANNVAALLKNYKQIDNVISDLDDAEGSALRENEEIVDSINGRIKTLSATAEEFWQSFIDTDVVKNVVSLASDILSTITKIIDKAHVLPTLVAGISAVLSAKNNIGKCYVSA